MLITCELKIFFRDIKKIGQKINLKENFKGFLKFKNFTNFENF